MKIIAMTSQKGGVGKTTLATNLAVAAALAGLKVLIVDADRQKTAIDWFYKRDNQDNPIVESAESQVDIERCLADAKNLGIDRVFIDTQGSDSNLASFAMRVADFVIIPCGAGGFDITAQKTTVDSVKLLQKPAGFVITKVNKRSSWARDARVALMMTEIPVCEHSTTNLKIYLDSAAFYHSTVLEMEPSSAAADEIKEIYRWLEKKLSDSKNILKAIKETNHVS